MMVVNAWSWYFVELLSRLVCQLTISFHTFLGMTFHVTGPRRNASFFQACFFFSCSCGNSGFEHGSVIVNYIFACFTLSLSTTQVNMIKEWCWLSQVNFFIEYFPHWINVLFISSQFLSRPNTQLRKISLSRCTNKHSQLGTLSNHAPIGLSQIAFPTTVLPKDGHTDFAQEERLGLPHWAMIWAILCRGRHIKMSGHSDLGIFWNFGASSFFNLSVSRYCVSCLSCAPWQALNMISMTFAAVICDADDPCSVNTA